MGQFPISNAIYADYEALEALDGAETMNHSLSTLLTNTGDEEIDTVALTNTYRQSCIR